MGTSLGPKYILYSYMEPLGMASVGGNPTSETREPKLRRLGFRV